MNQTLLGAAEIYGIESFIEPFRNHQPFPQLRANEPVDDPLGDLTLQPGERIALRAS